MHISKQQSNLFANFDLHNRELDRLANEVIAKSPHRGGRAKRTYKPFEMINGHRIPPFYYCPPTNISTQPRKQFHLFQKKNFLIASNTLGLNFQQTFWPNKFHTVLVKFTSSLFFPLSPLQTCAAQFSRYIFRFSRATRRKKTHSCSHPFSPESLIYHPSLFEKYTRT